MNESSNKVSVRRGITLPGSEAYSSERLDIEATVNIPAGMTVAEAAKELKESLDQLLIDFRSELKPSEASESKSTAEGPSSPPSLPPGYQTAASEPTPELDPIYLDHLPWRPFQSGGGSWIIRDTPGAKALSEELAKQGSPITIGNYRYKITQGRDREFINRIEVGKKV